MIQIKVKDLLSQGLKYSKWRELKMHSKNSLYKMNATSADCYAFGICDDGDYWGGWDWSSRLVDKQASYIYMLDTGKVFAI